MQNGKGDTYRPVNKKAYDEGWDRIWGKKEPKPTFVQRIKRLVKRKKK